MLGPTSTSGRGVKIKVTANTAQARADIGKLDRSFKNIEGSAARSITLMKRAAITAGSLFAGGAAAKGINRATDSFTEMENRIALVVGRGEELNKQMDELYKISLKTKAPIGASVELFNRMGVSLKASGASVKEINKAVVSLNKAAVISGGSIEGQKAAMIQLGQGLAAGALRGEELNSVMEQLPRVSKAIADELGVGIGQLREMAQEGKLTSDVVFKAMLNQAETLNAEFETMNITSAKAFSLFGDQLGRLTADLSKATGFTQSFTDRIVAATYYLADNREGIVASVVNFQLRIQDLKAELKDITSLDKFTNYLSKLFSSVSTLAHKHLGGTEKFIKGWAERISGYYFKIYDEVIGHSWWTDTMKETNSLAEDYLGRTSDVVGRFKDKVIGYFTEIYKDRGKGFKVSISASIEKASDIKQQIGKFIADGVEDGIDALYDLAPKIRKAFTLGLTSAFVFFFSTGSIVKGFTSIANKIGPLLALSLAAQFVKTINSPATFTAIGFLAGEAAGAIVNGIIQALPAIGIALVSGVAGGLVGLFKEAGIAGGLVAGIAFGAAVNKSFRKGTVTSLASAGAGLFNKDGAKGAKEYLKQFDKSSKITQKLQTAMYSVGTAIQTGFIANLAAAQPALTRLKTGVLANTLALRVGLVSAFNSAAASATTAAVAMRSRMVPALSTIGNIAGKTRLKMLGLAAAFTLFASGAFASSGDAADGGSGLGLGIAAAIGASLVGPDMLKALGKGIGFIGKKLGVGIALTMVRTLAISIGASIATAAAGIGAALMAPIAIAIAAVVAVGGIASILLFGEGDSFLKKVDSTMKKVGRRFNLLGEGNFEKKIEIRKTSNELASRGRLGASTRENESNLRAIKDLNLGALNDRSAGRVVDSISNLEAVSNEYNQELLTYGQASLDVQERLEAAQKETTEAVRIAASQAASRKELSSDIASVADGNLGAFKDFRLGIDRMQQFFGAERSELSVTNEQLQKLAEIDISKPEGLKSFATAAQLQGNLDLFPKEISDVLTMVANGLENPTQDLTDAVINKLEEVKNYDSFNYNLLGLNLARMGDQIGEYMVGESAATTGLAAAVLREPVARYMKAQEEINRLVSVALDAFGRNDVSSQARLDTGERTNIASLQGDVNYAEKDLSDIYAKRDNAENFQQREAYQVEIEIAGARLEELRAQLEQATTEGLQSALENSDYTSVYNKLIDLGIGDGLASQLANSFQSIDGDVSAALLGKTSIEIDEITKKIDAAKRLGSIDPVAIDELVRMQTARAEMIDLFTAGAEVQDLLEVTKDETRALLEEAIQLSGLDISIDKLLAIDQATIDKITGATAQVLALKSAASSGFGSILGLFGFTKPQDATAEANDIVSEVTNTLSGLGKGVLNPSKGGSKDSGSGATEITDFERLLKGTSLSIEQAVKLGATEASKISSALKAIEASEEKINKLAISNVSGRQAQLDIINKQRAAIDGILLNGTVGQAGSALSGLGLDEELAAEGPEAIAQGLKLVELQKELAMLNVNDLENIKLKTAEIVKQQEALDQVIDKSNSIEDVVSSSLSTNIADALKGGDLSNAFFGFFDDLTGSIIDSFVDGLVSSIMNSKMMTGLFDNLFKPETFSKLGEGLAGAFSGIGAAFGEGGSLSGIGSFFKGLKFFDSGGVVPNTPGSQFGKDSVPAMLKPGERVLSKNDIRNGQRGAAKGGSTSQFNINVTGDISRQTRREIQGMIPEIASGVNATNHESNYNY